jgi:hypothetical protein
MGRGGSSPKADSSAGAWLRAGLFELHGHSRHGDIDWVHVLHKRIRVVEGHKRRADYQMYVGFCEPACRKSGMPMTPNPSLECSKRVWETKLQMWRQQLRGIYAELIRTQKLV